MDDTICHYKKHYLNYNEKYPHIKYPQSVEGFFLDLEPIKDAKEIISYLNRDFDVWIVTRPSSKNPLCYTEKRMWLEKHYGLEMCEKLWFAPNKAMIEADYLIDDWLWKDFKGIQLQFGTDPYKTWDDIYTYFYK